jgi:hypothetical protein
LWRNTVIELSKLFNSSPKRDKYNIFHFIKKLRKDQYYGGLGVDQKKVDGWENRLEENRETINSIILLRDRVYGHTDNENAKKGLDTPTFEETQRLLEIVENVIYEIYSTVFDSHALIESPTVTENPSKIIKYLRPRTKLELTHYRTF